MSEQKSEIKFSDLSKCPFCSCEEYYTQNYMHGSSSYYQRFDSSEATDNSQMYDGLTVIRGKRAYCANCYRFLGNVESDLPSKNVRDKLKGVKWFLR